MTISKSQRRRLTTINVIASSLLAVLAIFLLGRSPNGITERVQLVASEIPGWVFVGLGVPAADALPDYTLVVEPDVLRAARLMNPSPGDASQDSDHWWFSAELVTGHRVYEVEAQLTDSAEHEGLRVRFAGRERPHGAREIEFLAGPAGAHARDLVATEAARDIGLIASPGGFARVSINGGTTRLVRWREGNSDAMLQRLGFPKGEIFRAVSHGARGHSDERLPRQYAPTVGRRTPGSQAQALTRFISLVRGANAGEFAAEIANLVDVDQVLAWNALTLLLDDAGREETTQPDWYFDPVSGLLKPVVRTLAPPRAGSTAPKDAQLLVSRLLALPGFRAQRDALLGEWLGVTRSARLEAIDQGLGNWAARLARSGGTFERAAELARLADLRRASRHTLDAHADSLRQQLALGLLDPVGLARSLAAAPEPASPQGSDIREWVASSGLRFRVDGDRLVLPAGRHYVEHTLVVPTSHRLVILPGARLVMSPGVSLLTFRGIEAIGTRQRPIEIRARDPRMPWGSLGVARAPERSELAYVTVSGGSNARYRGIDFTAELAFNQSDVILRDSDVRDGHGDDAFSVRRGTFQVARSRFIDNASDGFDAEWATGSVESCLFANNGDDGLDLATSEVRVHRGWFRRMGDKAISAGERSHVVVSDSTLVDSQIAIASKEDSRVEVRGTEFRRNEIGISLYRDNRVFGSGYGTIDGGLFAENLRDFAVETGSGLTLNGVERSDVSSAGIVIGLRDSLGSASSTIQ